MKSKKFETKRCEFRCNITETIIDFTKPIIVFNIVAIYYQLNITFYISNLVQKIHTILQFDTNINLVKRFHKVQ